jgi:predicted Zn-dependent protease
MSQAQLAQIGLIAAVIVKPGLAQFGDLASQGMGLLFLKFGRDDETQADDLGFKYMTAGGYSPTEMAEMFRTLQRLGGGSNEGRVPEWLSTHPDPGNRVEKTLQRTAATSLPTGLKVERDAFLQRTEGLIFGENPREGFFRQQQFLHPELKFQLDFPSGWQTQNQPSAVASISPQQDALVVLALAGTASPNQALSEFFGQQGITNQGTSSGSINGMPAASGTFTANTQDGVLAGNVAFVSLDNRTFRLLAYTPQQRYSAYRGVFTQSLGSFRRLTDPAALAVQPVRVRLVRLPRAMTMTEFHQAYPSPIPLAQVALINGVEPTTTLPAGTLVKRVQ